MSHTYVVVGFVAYIIVLWVGVGFLIGLISGWRELARSYRCARFKEASWKFQSGRMRMLMSFRSVLNVDVDSRGLYLATIFPFHVGFPPLSIPWQDIFVRSGKFLFWRYVELRFRQAPTVFLQLPTELAEEMAKKASGSWPVDRGAAIPF
jgi:hypothetical protein